MCAMIHSKRISPMFSLEIFLIILEFSLVSIPLSISLSEIHARIPLEAPAMIPLIFCDNSSNMSLEITSTILLMISSEMAPKILPGILPSTP